MKMRLLRPLLVAAFVAATPSLAAAATERQEPDIDMYAHISGRCTTLKIAGRDFASVFSSGVNSGSVSSTSGGGGSSCVSDPRSSPAWSPRSTGR
jgi:hypothetical protein